MVKKQLDDILRDAIQNSPSDIRSVAYNIVEQVMFHLPEKDITWECYRLITVTFINSKAATKGLSKRVSTMSPFSVQVVTLLADKQTRQWKTVSTVLAYCQLSVSIQIFNYDTKFPPSCSDSRSDKVPNGSSQNTAQNLTIARQKVRT